MYPIGKFNRQQKKQRRGGIELTRGEKKCKIEKSQKLITREEIHGRIRFKRII